MYFIIGIWGGANRLYAAIKFFIYTMVGSLLMLVAILALVWQVRAATGHALVRLRPPAAARGCCRAARRPGSSPPSPSPSPSRCRSSRSTPGCPTRTSRRRPRAACSWPACCSRSGTYGFLRFAVPFFPQVALSPAVSHIMVALAVIGIIYGALVAMVQPDIKKLVAYSSVSHLGFVMLGIWGGTAAERAGRADGDDQPRHLDRGAVPPGRHALRAAAHPR